MAVIERQHPMVGISAHRVGVFLGTCALHAIVISYVINQPLGNGLPLADALKVSFLPAERTAEPPPPAPIPVLPADAFAERPPLDIPPPSVDIAMPQEVPKAIHAPPPELPPEFDPELEDGEGYGPLTKPRAISGPKSQDWYPRASIRKRESGRPVVKICISETGTVTSVDLAESSGYPRLDRAAVDIGWGYVFAPAMREGKPVAVCINYGIRFRISIGLSGRR